MLGVRLRLKLVRVCAWFLLAAHALLGSGCERQERPGEEVDRLRQRVEQIVVLSAHEATRRKAYAEIRQLGDAAVPVLEALGHPEAADPISAWACLVELGSTRSFEALLRIMRRARRGSYEWHSVANLLAIFLCKNDWSAQDVRGIPGAYELLASYIDYPDQCWPWTTARLIGRLAYEPGIPKLHEYASGQHGELTRRAALEALARLGYVPPASSPTEAPARDRP